MTDSKMVVADELPRLAEEINSEHHEVMAATAAAVAHAIRAGEALLRARELVPRGGWERWIDDNTPIVARMARDYMRVASYRDAIPQRVTLTDALKALRGLPAFDGSGPRRHPPEVRERALNLVAQGMSQRKVAAIVGVDHKCVGRWVSGEPEPSREAIIRRGRPTRAQRRERAQLIAESRSEQEIGPSVLVARFRAVWDAHTAATRQPDADFQRDVLAAKLRDLADSALGWADRVKS